jgi:regulator of sirC expression with transglutaminase-like and TPR domain
MLDLTEYLISENLSTFAQKTLDTVSDHGNVRYMQSVAQIHTQHAPSPDFQKAVNMFDDILDIDPTSIKSLSDSGHAYYKMGNK